MKSYSYAKRVANKFGYMFKKNKLEFEGGNKLLTEDNAITAFNNLLDTNKFAYVSLSHYEVNLLHEYWKHLDKGKGDYSKKVYLPEDYRVNSIIGTISKFSIDHVANQYIKDLEKVTMINFDEYFAEERMFVSSSDQKCLFTNLPKEYSLKSNLLQYLDGKRVLVLSSFSDLIRIQNLKQDSLHPGNPNAKGNFVILTLNIEEIYHQHQAYSLFEKLDTLKVEILKYDFDVALVNLSTLNLPVVSFISSLHHNAIALGDEIYKVFGIAADSAEKSKHNFWVDLNSYRKGNEDTFLATGVIGAPIKMKKPKRGKHVR